MSELTFGQKLVGIKFNPSNNLKVDRVKEICAELADLIEVESRPRDDAFKRILFENTTGDILKAQMMAVKLITL